MYWLSALVLLTASLSTNVPSATNSQLRNLHAEDQSCAHWTTMGMQAMQKGDERSAAALFAAGARRHASDSSMWINTAVAQASLLASGQVEPGGEVLELYCEARAAALLALRAGDSEAAAGLLQSIESELAGPAKQAAAAAAAAAATAAAAAAAAGAESGTIAEPRCPYSDVLPRLHRVIDTRNAGGLTLETYLQAVRDVCDAESLMVQLAGRRNKQGSDNTGEDISASDLLVISSLLDACGVVAVMGVHTQATVDRAREAQLNHYSRINRTQLEQHGAKSATSGRSSEFRDMAVRGHRRRVEATLPLSPTFNEIIAAPALLSIVEYIMHDPDLELDTHSYVHAEPGSPQQLWHRDVDFLHDEAAAAARNGTTSYGSAHHTPPHGVVAVVPLVDLNTNNGATEFVIGSHVHPAVLGQALDLWDGEVGTAHWEGTPLLSRAKLLVPRGSVVLFDLRMTHRGGPNESESARSVMYTSYVREWFRDAVNFMSPQSAWWGTLRSERLQKLFARVDGRQYTQQLEKLLEQKGVDVKSELLLLQQQEQQDELQ